MLANRTFRIVFVSEGRGIAGGITSGPDQVVEYSGSAFTVRRPGPSR
jgi:hypothetical protein